jgi:hypothetical protein
MNKILLFKQTLKQFSTVINKLSIYPCHSVKNLFREFQMLFIGLNHTLLNYQRDSLQNDRGDLAFKEKVFYHC